jgi:hypothetical protein
LYNNRFGKTAIQEGEEATAFKNKPGFTFDERGDCFCVQGQGCGGISVEVSSGGFER